MPGPLLLGYLTCKQENIQKLALNRMGKVHEPQMQIGSLAQFHKTAMGIPKASSKEEM